ncbi:hypothetical protein GCM10009415_01610 [Chitinophaga japonensis]
MGLLMNTGCSESNSVTDLEPQLPADSTIIIKDEAYGDDPEQRMDIYLPAGRTTAATRSIVFIHGGAWTGGDKDEFSGIIDSLMRQGAAYACFSINYRLADIGKNQYPAAAEDVQRALQYIQQQQQRFQVSPAIALLGTSAGAHLAALQAYKHNEGGNIKAVACLYGVYDLAALFTQTTPAIQLILTNFMGGIPLQEPEAYQEASPVNYVTTQGAPAFVMYGTQDSIAPVEQPQQFLQKLEAEGVVHTSVSYESGHGIPPAFAADAWSRTFAFIDAHLGAE